MYDPEAPNALDQFIDQAGVEPENSRLLLEDVDAKYWFVELPASEKRRFCIVIQSLVTGDSGISCSTAEQFADVGAVVLLHSEDLAHAGLVRPEAVDLDQGSRFKSTGDLVYLTVGSEGFDQLVQDFATMVNGGSK